MPALILIIRERQLCYLDLRVMLCVKGPQSLKISSLDLGATSTNKHFIKTTFKSTSRKFFICSNTNNNNNNSKIVCHGYQNYIT